METGRAGDNYIGGAHATYTGYTPPYSGGHSLWRAPRQTAVGEDRKSFEQAPGESSDGITAAQGRIIIALLAVIAFALTAMAVLMMHATWSTPKWEYAVEVPPDIGFSRQMNRWGEEGWELVSARRASGAGRTFSYEVIMKRPK